MDLPQLLQDTLLTGRALHQVSDHIYSAFPPGTGEQHYDRMAAGYDWVVGSRIYNRLIWGSSPPDYAAFARQAIDSADGYFLDAGCGSMLFTADVYAKTARPVIAIDQSVGMLTRARDRLVAAHGRMPESVYLVQADLFDLPFGAARFQTVMCMGMLHLFEDITGLVSSLQTLLKPGGGLFMTSLVAEGNPGARYLSMLHRAGEVATPRRADELQHLLTSALAHPVDFRVKGSMAYTSLKV